MGQDSQTAPDLFDDVDYDPLLDLEPDEDDLDDGGGQLAPSGDAQAKMLYEQKADDRTPEERIVDLFESLEPRRRVLLGILEYLDEPKRSDALQEKVVELQEYDHSVYSGYDYSLLLEEAGAIRKVSEDGSEFDEEEEQLPDIVEVDGERFYKPTDGKQVFWVVTDEGRAYREADDPFGRLTALLSKDEYYHEIYRDVLTACESEAGQTIDGLTAIVDANPRSKNPRRHSSYFAKHLEDCGALRWAGSWKTTEVGTKGLELLLEQMAEAAEKAAAGEDGDVENDRATEGE